MQIKLLFFSLMPSFCPCTAMHKERAHQGIHLEQDVGTGGLITDKVSLVLLCTAAELLFCVFITLFSLQGSCNVVMCSGLLFGDGSPFSLCCHTSTYRVRVDGARREGTGGGVGFSQWRKGCVYVYRV